MDRKRRDVLAGLGVVTTVGLGATQTLAQSDSDSDSDSDSNEGPAEGPAPEITEVREEAEWIFIENLGTGTYDASNHWVEFEYKGEVNQRRQLPEGTEIGSLLIATGAKDVQNSDIAFDFESSVIANDDSDAIALLTPEGEPVAVNPGVNWDGDIGSSDETTTTEDSKDSEETTTNEEETTTTTEETDSGTDSDSNSGGAANETTDDSDSDSSTDSGGSSGSNSGNSDDEKSSTDGKQDC